MIKRPIVVPVIVSIGQCTITAPWFVQDTEYPPAQATYDPLVNGEEAFASVHHAIANAKKSVDIICWGFQPSMYFIRDGTAPCIGELLVKIAREKQVQVRILGWEMPLNSAGFVGEANLPGKGVIRISDRAGQCATEEQYAYDRRWFKAYSLTGELADVVAGMDLIAGRAAQADLRNARLRSLPPLFVSRGFDTIDRTEIAYQAALHSFDREISAASIGTMAGSATHHQKTVLVDYELAEHAVGFVMGHNMLDEYWDTDDHSAQYRGTDKPAPNAGARGELPRQDISARVTGPILEHLHANFARAWCRETGQDLFTSRNAKAVGRQLKPRAGFGRPLMAQLLRTQAQEGRRDIEALYLNAVNNATQFIYIENQYFRWPPLAEAIKKAAADQTREGRDPGKHGALHLFVVTNVTDQGIGSGTVNTQRMLESLGRADTIPEITKLRRIEALRNNLPTYFDPRDPATAEKLAEYKQKVEEIQNSKIESQDHPGLKTHICSLVAKDSAAHSWMPVYIHSKLMIINDVFTTHGSANINTRSMQVDSEMNIAHEWASVTKALRQRLWKLHTSGKGVQDDAGEAFFAWEDILEENKTLQKTMQDVPVAPLIEFQYNAAKLKDLD
ncbi:MAG TPA: phospholipase D-like domain-containing protein [Enterobacteriaceae bacterium]|nr:phospholipase D-like domain-containing protein [Enterobacteriaceae bacterium]